MSYNFVPGTYQTRDGRKAIVHFVLQQPNDCIYLLVGEVQNSDGRWQRQTWMLDGTSFAGIVSELDLVEPKAYFFYELTRYGILSIPAKELGSLKALRVELKHDGSCDWSTLTLVGCNNEERAIKKE